MDERRNKEEDNAKLLRKGFAEAINELKLKLFKFSIENRTENEMRASCIQK